MKKRSVLASVVSPRRGVTRTSDGFTLIELMIVMVIMPLIVGAIAFGLVSVFSLQSGVAGRITDSGNAQVVSSTFSSDVQSAALVEIKSTPVCGTGTQLLGLAWSGSGSTPGGYVTRVSYVTVPSGSTNSYLLVRNFCTGGSSTPTSSTTAATDLNSTTAVTPATVSCSLFESCLPLTLGTPSYWISTRGVIQITFTIAETQSRLPTSNTPFTFSLEATPRLLSEVSNPVSKPPFAPFTLLGTSCASSALSIGNGSLSIDVGTGTGNGVLGIASSCPNAVSISNNGNLNATSILTGDPTLNSVAPCNPCSYPTSETYTNQITDPFANLNPPTVPPLGGTAATCAPDASGTTYTCPPGNYAANPGTGVGGFPTSGIVINFTPGGTYWFKNGLTLPNGAVANFSTGTYIFDAPTPSGTALSTGTNGVVINGQSGVLFYIHSGSVTFGNNVSISLAGLSQYDNVTIWDPAAGAIPTLGTSIPLTLGNNGSSGLGYGGIYVPNGEVIDNNNGNLTCSFIVSSSASFANGLNVNITAP